MKKLMTTIVCLLFIGLFHVNAQTINGFPISDINVDYFGVVYSESEDIRVDLGALNGEIYTNDYKRWNGTYKTIIKDEDGEVIEFPSAIYLINFLSFHGFKLASTSHEYHQHGSQTKFHYIMEKKK